MTDVIKLNRPSDAVLVDIDGTVYSMTPRLSLNTLDLESLVDSVSRIRACESVGDSVGCARESIEVLARFSTIPKDVLLSLPMGMIIELFQVFNRADVEDEKKTRPSA